MTKDERLAKAQRSLSIATSCIRTADGLAEAVEPRRDCTLTMTALRNSLKTALRHATDAQTELAHVVPVGVGTW